MTTPSAIRAGSGGQWLLDLTLAGRTWRWSERAVEVVDAAGNSWRYRAGLEPMEVVVGAASVALTIHDLTAEWALYAAQGHDLEQGSAVLRWWHSGTLEHAEVVARGDVVDVEHSDPDQPGRMVCSLQQVPIEDLGIIPENAAVINATTHPTSGAGYEYDEEAEGAVLPLVLGGPGYAPHASPAGIVAAVEAYLVNFTQGAAHYWESKLGIAWGEVAASTVHVWDTSDGTHEARPVHTDGETLLGDPYSYVDFDGAVTIAPVLGHRYVVSFDIDELGLLREDRSGALRGAGEILVALLRGRTVTIEGTRLPIDRGAQEAQRSQLDGYHIDAAVAAQVDLIQWLEDEVLWWLPADWRMGDQGWYLAHLDRSLNPSLVKTHLIAGVNGHRASANRRIGPDDVQNRLTIEYGYSADTGEYTARRSLGTEARPHWRCSTSQSRYGVREEIWQCQAMYDPETVEQALRVLARLHALPRRGFAWQGGPDLDALRPGDHVLVTDPAVYWSEVECLVLDAPRGSEAPVVTLELLADPILRDREGA